MVAVKNYAGQHTSLGAVWVPGLRLSDWRLRREGYTEPCLLRLVKYGDAELGSAGVSPAVARATCPRVCWGGTPQQLRPGRPRYIKQCHPILQASGGDARPNTPSADSPSRS